MENSFTMIDTISESILEEENNGFKNFNPELNLAVMASGKGTNFESLLKFYKNSKKNVQIKLLIVNKPNCGAINIANKYNIPFEYIEPKKSITRKEYDNLILKILNKYNIEGIVMAGWMRIITNSLISKYKNRIINIHPSLLPSFKGVNAIQQALDSGVKIAGCTAHFVVEEVDSGQIISQAALKVLSTDNYDSLQLKIQKLEHNILPYSVLIAARKWRKDCQG